MATALEKKPVYGISLGTRAALLITACAVVATLIELHGHWWSPLFFDARAYAEAITRYRQGQSPYITSTPRLFLYPPAFVLSGAWIAKVIPPAFGWKLYLAVHVAAVLALPFILARGYLRPMRDAEAVALYFATPLGLTVTVLVAGNIASLFYCLAFLAALPGMYHNRWRYFYVVVVIASATKITLLVLLLLPLLAAAGEILPSVVTIAATGVIYALQWILLPNLYGQFRHILSFRIFGQRNYGGAFFGFAANLLHAHHAQGLAIAWAVQIVLSAVILFTLLWLRKRTNPLDRRWLALILIAIILVNPRDMYYETIVAMVPAYFLLLSNLRLRLTWVLIAITAAGFCVHHGALGELLIPVSGFIAGARSLTMAEPGRLVEI